MTETDNTVGDISMVIKKRLRPAAISAAIVLTGTMAIIFSLPAIYESTASLLIEQADLQP